MNRRRRIQTRRLLRTETTHAGPPGALPPRGRLASRRLALLRGLVSLVSWWPLLLPYESLDIAQPT